MKVYPLLLEDISAEYKELYPLENLLFKSMGYDSYFTSFEVDIHIALK